jgi:hypothetical protein
VSKTRKPSSSASTLTQPLPIIHTLFCFTSISISLTIFSLTSINQSINRFQRITHSSATAQPQLISFYFIYFLYNNNIINIIITTKILVYDDVWWWIEFEDEIIIIHTYQFGHLVSPPILLCFKEEKNGTSAAAEQQLLPTLPSYDSDDFCRRRRSTFSLRRAFLSSSFSHRIRRSYPPETPIHHGNLTHSLNIYPIR